MTTIEEEIEASFLSGNNIYVSGVGGTGKSFLIKKLFNKYKNKNGNSGIFLTSTTGISAHNIGGRTINGWAGFNCPDNCNDPEKVITKCLLKIKHNKLLLKKWKTTKTLFLDEISMLGGTYLTLLDAVAKIVRQNQLPFGGIQIVCTGDMLQLPPVKDVYPFEVDVWNSFNFKYFNLIKCYRFDDTEYVELLKRARLGCLNANDIKLLKSRMNLDIGDIIPTILLSHNQDVYTKNKEEIDKLPGELVIYYANDSFVDFKGKQIKSMFPSEIEDEFSCEKILYLKKGAQVMLTVNLDVDNGFVNGSRGVVTDILSDKINVKFMNGMNLSIEKHDFKVEINDIEYTRTTYPLKLCWATTIHKSQGLTLDCIYIDIGENIFCPGQAYVALSRCRNLKSLYIKKFNQTKIFPSKIAMKFENKYLLSDTEH